MERWWLDSIGNMGSALASAAVFYVLLIVVTRVAGLRAYSKMSGFDFPLTIAVGSIVASTILVPDPPLVRAGLIMGWILFLQGAIAWLRSRFPRVRGLVDNQPLVLMREGKLMDEHMRKARVSLPELREKLRDAQVQSLENVGAVVLETTGDVTVIPAPEGRMPDAWIMEGVRGWHESAHKGTVPTPPT